MYKNGNCVLGLQVAILERAHVRNTVADNFVDRAEINENCILFLKITDE